MYARTTCTYLCRKYIITILVPLAHTLPQDSKALKLLTGSKLAITSTDPVYLFDCFRSTRPPGKCDLLPTAVYCAFHLSTLSCKANTLSVIRLCRANTLSVILLCRANTLSVILLFQQTFLRHLLPSDKHSKLTFPLHGTDWCVHLCVCVIVCE